VARNAITVSSNAACAGGCRRFLCVRSIGMIRVSLLSPEVSQKSIREFASTRPRARKPDADLVPDRPRRQRTHDRVRAKLSSPRCVNSRRLSQLSQGCLDNNAGIVIRLQPLKLSRESTPAMSDATAKVGKLFAFDGNAALVPFEGIVAAVELPRHRQHVGAEVVGSLLSRVDNDRLPEKITAATATAH